MSLQLEHKELKKKQRRSERYYTNKQTKDSQSTSVHEDDVDMVGDVSLQGELTPDDRSEEGWYMYKMKLQVHVAHQLQEPSGSGEKQANRPAVGMILLT